MALKLSKRQTQMLKDYEHLLNSPFADGYSYMAFESKYKTTTEKVRELYEKYKESTRKELSKEEAFDLIKKEVEAYIARRSHACAPIFPQDEIIKIVECVK